jgi:hypothetical protein
MSPQREAAPRLPSRSRQSERGSANHSRSARSVHNDTRTVPNINIRRRSPIVPSLFLGLCAFALIYLAGHVLAAIIGWDWLVIAGFVAALWIAASIVTAGFLGAVFGAVRRD